MLFLFLAEFGRIGDWGREKERERGRIGEESGKKEGISRPRNGGKNERKKDDESEGSEMKGEEGGSNGDENGEKKVAQGKWCDVRVSKITERKRDKGKRDDEVEIVWRRNL